MSNHYCTKCGNRIQEEGNFCSKCGNVIENRETYVQEENKGKEKRLRKKPLLIFTPILVLIIAASLYFVFANKSKVAGVSDEVYEQLVEQYFFLETMAKWHEGEIDLDMQSWIESQEQFKEAQVFAEEYFDETGKEINAHNVFPNPLFVNILMDEEQFNEKEKDLIAKVRELFFFITSYRYDDYKVNSKEVKQLLKIDDSDNPFSY